SSLLYWDSICSLLSTGRDRMSWLAFGKQLTSTLTVKLNSARLFSFFIFIISFVLDSPLSGEFVCIFFVSFAPKDLVYLGIKKLDIRRETLDIRSEYRRLILAYGCWLIAICHSPSAIRHLPSAIRHSPSAICHQPSAVHHST